MSRILTTQASKNYELLDSGDGEKLERFGTFVLRRPDPQVLWKKNKPDSVWKEADAHFAQQGMRGGWTCKTQLPSSWDIDLDIAKLTLKLGNNKHIGFFPEQVSQWQWLVDQVVARKEKNETEGSKKILTALNLFGYTGGASCALARGGVEVTHVDASKASIAWAHVNKKKSELEKESIRFMLDDARKFVEREIKRGVKYDVILLEPPVYGKGVDKKQWHIEEDFLPLLERTVLLLSDVPLCVVLSGYASQYSDVTYAQALSGACALRKDITFQVESGQLTIEESGSGRLLPAGIFARAVFG